MFYCLVCRSRYRHVRRADHLKGVTPGVCACVCVCVCVRARSRNLNNSVAEFELLHSNIYFLGAFTKLRKATITFVKSVCPHGTTVLPLDGF
jgi:hypothetical protein